MTGVHPVGQEAPVSGVILSIPPSPQSHNLGGIGVHDTSRSWSTSNSIRVKKASSGWEVSVVVYNLGMTEGLVCVEAVFWTLRKDGMRSSFKKSLALNVFIEGNAPGTYAPTIQTDWILIETPPDEEITHIYALAYDPMFDWMDAAAVKLMADAVPDFSTNAARASRQIGCLNVAYAERLGPLKLDWVFKHVIGHTSPRIENLSAAPLEFVIMNIKALPTPVELRNGADGPLLAADIRSIVGQIFSFGETISEDIYISLASQNPRCAPNCDSDDPAMYRYKSPYFLRDKGVFIDGVHSGKGTVVDVRDFSFDTPWGVNGEVSIRLIMR
ncbi:hypothetical protein [Hoeflea sp. 108]|uniref:hypothetical protein n=1 Tax=Hoeflea sp. 108 TaxID=1116369 RepID=UPI0012F82189|nr:hypothetical protein [Hoeflea sp. 108]